MLEERHAWIAATAALMGPVGAALANWWSRKTNQEKHQNDWREQSAKRLSDLQDAALAHLHARIRELEGDVVRMEEERNRGWDRARAAHALCHEINHVLNNTAQKLPPEQRPQRIVVPRLSELSKPQD
jgi:Flp pilus assembly protein TadB